MSTITASAANRTLRIETGNGVLALELEIADGKRSAACGSTWASRSSNRPQIPVELPDRSAPIELSIFPLTSTFRIGEPAELDGRLRLGSADDVRFDGQSARGPVLPARGRRSRWSRSGRVFERQPIFPKRINVHFVQVHRAGEVTMRTWERGSGITLACGTGACAVCVAGVLTGRTERRILAHLPGGDLELEWAADNHVYMTGEAVEVFSGEWNGSRMKRRVVSVPPAHHATVHWPLIPSSHDEDRTARC